MAALAFFSLLEWTDLLGKGYSREDGDIRSGESIVRVLGLLGPDDLSALS